MQIQFRAWLKSQLFIILLLLVLFAQLALGARQLSFTADEPAHIASGYAYLARGTTWAIPTHRHPPLINAWEASIFYLGNPSIPLETLDGWEENHTRYVHAFVPYIKANVRQAEVTTRTPIMLLTLLLAAVVVRWARDFFGDKAGFIALVVLVFDPTLLAHGMLATTDIGVIALGTLGFLMLSRFMRHPHFKRAVAIGLVMGLTLLAKGSGIIWLGAAGLMMGFALLRNKPSWSKLWRWLGYSITIVIVALACVWICYDFEWGRLSQLPFSVPAPTHWMGIWGQSSGGGERWTYFLGQVRQGGHWAYFLVAFLLKNPIPFIVLIVGGVLWNVFRQVHSPHVKIALWIFPVLYFSAALYTGVNIGYRHLLPLHPFFYLAIAALPIQHRLIKPVTWGLLVWVILESLMIAPHYVTYFNQSVGGPEQGWRYLADSNTDWGQGYKALQRYQRQTSLTFGYSGLDTYIKPTTYNVELIPLPPLHDNPEPELKPWLYPTPGNYIISANTLSGLGSVSPDNYAWFRYHLPQASIAHTLFHYRVEPLPNDLWLAQCSTPAIPLDDATIAEGFATLPARHITFDCTQAWIYPKHASKVGWYALHAGILQSGSPVEHVGLKPHQSLDDFISRRLASFPISYRQCKNRAVPAFALYESSVIIQSPSNTIAYPARAETIPSTLINTYAETTPIPLDGPLTLLGVNTYKNTPNIEVETWWLVTQDAPSMQLSLMAHFVTSEGQILGVADGLGIMPAQWQEGDIIIQRHQFSDIPDDQTLWLRTGAYRLDNGMRLEITASSYDNSPNDAVFVVIDK